MSTFNGMVAEFPHIRIDCFTPATTPSHPPPLAVFVSHVHADHLKGLVSFKSPFIYCSHATRAILLRLETRFHRLNFARGTLESRKQTYKHLTRLLRPIPLGTPTILELSPTETIRVTLLDANHCPGAVMFLLERPGGGPAVLYTGDIRAETWWVNALAREPSMIPYGHGLKRLDRIYLDTTFATRADLYRDFEPKYEGIAELLEKVAACPSDSVFYFNAWTFGYEDALVALAQFLESKVHVDHYRWKLYRNLLEGEGRDIRVAAPLVGYQEGHRWHAGCLTMDDGPDVRIHSCEKGAGCEILNDKKVVRIIPLVTRHDGVEYSELGLGGGHGDLDQVHELEFMDRETLGQLSTFCLERLKDRPEFSKRFKDWLKKSVSSDDHTIRLDLEAIQNLLGDSQSETLDEALLQKLVATLEDLMTERKKSPSDSREIRFPYSRHASFGELRELVQLLKPRSVFPNTVEKDMESMESLFGDVMNDDQQRSAAECNEERKQLPEETAILVATDYDDATTKPGQEDTHVKNDRTNDDLRLTSSTISPRKKTEEGKRKLVAALPSSGDSEPERRKQKISRTEASEAAQRRLRAYKAALSSQGSDWASDVHLVSVTGYHNQEDEVEL